MIRDSSASAARFRGGIGPWLGFGALSLLVFIVVRGLDRYGNFGPYRGGNSALQWLRTSKYPPSLAFAASELALVVVSLAIWTKWSAPAPLLVLGRTALVFYVSHVHVLKGAAFALGVDRAGGLGVTCVAWVVTLMVLYPGCVVYDRWKRRYPRSALRFV